MMEANHKTVRVVARITARPGCSTELRAVLAELVEPTCREQGCILYQLHENPNDPCDFVFIEEWATAGDLDTHSKSAHLAAARARWGPLMVGGPDVRTYRLIR